MDLKRIISYPARWRRSKGFGVHSPFAFNFITKVIGEREAEYYAYAEIAAFCPKARKAGFNEIFAGRDMSVPEAWMLFRVLCHFAPSIVVEAGHGDEVTNIIVERALPHCSVEVWDASHVPDMKNTGDTEPFVLINQCLPQSKDNLMNYARTLLENGDTVFFMRNLHSIPVMATIWEEITSMTGYGMGFTDGYTGIYVGRRSLPHQTFDILM
ncbi:MAG: hypothetical protein HDS68_02105 [Bacteroidales bacterium]|nr:hypothetical protein [Bacteroidales bacterium]